MAIEAGASEAMCPVAVSLPPPPTGACIDALKLLEEAAEEAAPEAAVASLRSIFMDNH